MISTPLRWPRACWADRRGLAARSVARRPSLAGAPEGVMRRAIPAIGDGSEMVRSSRSTHRSAPPCPAGSRTKAQEAPMCCRSYEFPVAEGYRQLRAVWPEHLGYAASHNRIDDLPDSVQRRLVLCHSHCACPIPRISSDWPISTQVIRHASGLFGTMFVTSTLAVETDSCSMTMASGKSPCSESTSSAKPWATSSSVGGLSRRSCRAMLQ